MLGATPAWSVIRYGDRALLVQFESRIDPEINRFVAGLYEALRSKVDSEIEFLIPAYNSLTIGLRSPNFDLNAWKTLIEIHFDESRAGQGSQLTDKTGRLVEIPVCYEPPFSLDLETLVAFSGLSQEQVIERHHAFHYRVYMLGFLPGFAYLGSVDAAIACPRRDKPRRNIPAGSVGIADFQTGVYPSDAPGGWQIIGRTPIALEVCTPQSLRPGDKVTFRRIDASTFESLSRARRPGDRQ